MPDRHESGRICLVMTDPMTLGSIGLRASKQTLIHRADGEDARHESPPVGAVAEDAVLDADLGIAIALVGVTRLTALRNRWPGTTRSARNMRKFLPGLFRAHGTPDRLILVQATSGSSVASSSTSVGTARRSNASISRRAPLRARELITSGFGASRRLSGKARNGAHTCGM